jgi:hypothetical protein
LETRRRRRDDGDETPACSPSAQTSILRREREELASNRTSRGLALSLGTGLVLAVAPAVAAPVAIADTNLPAKPTVATAPVQLSRDAPQAAVARSWQKWSKWTRIPNAYKQHCRTYVDATTKGSRILLSGAVFCKRPNSAAIFLAPNRAKSKSRFCSARVMKDHGFCDLHMWVKNPRGSQQWRVATGGNTWGERLPDVRIVFKA